MPDALLTWRADALEEQPRRFGVLSLHARSKLRGRVCGGHSNALVVGNVTCEDRALTPRCLYFNLFMK
jgi:hypothetical protein